MGNETIASWDINERAVCRDSLRSGPDVQGGPKKVSTYRHTEPSNQYIVLKPVDKLSFESF